MIEREIKLQFETAGEARTAILAAGAAPLKCRRLQEDALFDTNDESLRRQGCALRVRSESGRSLLTFKGPMQASRMIENPALLLLLALYVLLWREAPRLATRLERDALRGLVLTIAIAGLFNSALMDHVEGLLFAWGAGVALASRRPAIEAR